MHCDVSVTFDPHTPDGRHTIIIIGLNGMWNCLLPSLLLMTRVLELKPKKPC